MKDKIKAFIDGLMDGHWTVREVIFVLVILGFVVSILT